jgi:hypothetical protein
MSFGVGIFNRDAAEGQQYPMEIYYVGDSILHFNYTSVDAMHAAGNRFHVFYEDPLKQGRLVTDRQSWSGYNFPPNFFSSFTEDELTHPEQELHRWGIAYPNHYFILTYQNPNLNQTIIHETAHALYSTNAMYRDSIDQKLAEVDLEPIRKVLGHYSESVFYDEAQAYLIEWRKIEIKLKSIGEDSDQFIPIHQELEYIYNHHAQLKITKISQQSFWNQ